MKTKLLSAALLAAAWLAGGMAWAQSEPAQDSDGWYLLGTVDDVEWFGQQVMDGKHATIKGKLTADIDYEGVENRHRPIGHYGQKFVGKFDGQGHRILNMVLNDPTLPKGNDDGTGFFGCVRVGGDGFIMGSDTEKETNDLVEIKNLIIDASCTITSSRANTAGLVGRISEKTTNNTVLIENCINEATIVTTANAPAGIVGQINNAAEGNVIIRNCVNKGTVTTSGLAAAGIISQVNNCAVKLNIESCMNLADVKSTGNKNCGGIHGGNASSKGIIKIINCGNTGNVTGTDESAALTGWIGSNSGNVITNCWNSGTVTGVKGTDNTYRGTVTVTNVYDINGGQGTVFTNDDITSGKLCYLLNGDQNTINWYQNLTTGTVDAYPVPDGNGHAQVYQVADYYCDGTPKGSVVYSNTDGGSKDDHVFDTTTGLCTRCSYPKEDWLSADADGFYYLGTPEQVEWFSHMVRDAHHNAMNVKLTADIDFGGVADAHLPIGTNTQKYFGHFDGQGHRIKGMVLTTANDLKERANDGQGFFGSVRGGGVADGNTIDEVIIENLIIDASCSVTHDQNFVAGVVGRVQAVNSGSSVVIIRNCGNEANVTTSGKNAAGILGCVASTNVGLKLYNLWNKGTIVGNGGESAAICAWTGQRNVDGEVDVEGCWNIGEVTGIDANHYNMIRRNTNIVPRNIVDLCIANGTKGGNQGVVSVWNSADPISSGELCYLLNGDQTNIVYTQTIGTDEMPVYGTSSSQVYQAGTVDCLGAAVGTVNYNNVSGETTQLGHNINLDWGMCDVCHAQSTFQAPELVDGYYELRNAGNVEWYSQYVAAAGGSHSGAKLMNDIDFYNIENLHSPIGPNAGNKFNSTFDGQGYSIKNMIIERPTESNIGFFGWLRGGGGNNTPTTVKNLIIDGSCSIHGYNRVGGVTGTYQNGGTTITIENVVNEATVTAEHQDAGGIFGGHDAGGPTIIIRNVLNTGTITAKNEHPYAGALCCYMQVANDSKIENFVNLGTINGHEGGNIGRHNIGNVKNLIDLSATTDKTQGVVDGLTADDVAGGKLAYTVGWWQELGVDAYPTPFEKAGAVVYRTGEERCDGADIATTVYSNTDGTIVTGSHGYSATTGLCEYCSQPNPDFKSLVDGAYELANLYDVKWFEAMVNYGSPAINGKMTVDALDFEGGSCRIGNDANSYRGTFQGNGVVVSNFVIDNDLISQGFFGWVTGGADISGIVFDNTCSISCNERAGIIGAAKDGGTVKITRLGNEGNVTTTSRNAGGIIGTDLSGACTLLIDQCYSTGAIKGGYESAQIAGWTGSTSKITNSWSCATVEGIQEGRPFSRYGGDNHDAQFENCFSTMTENNAGLTYDVPAEKFASGEVAYTLNTAAGKQCFGQFLGIDEHPVFDNYEVSYVGDAGYATLYDTTTGYELNGDIKAYAAVLNNTWLDLSEIGNEVPAGNAVVLKGTYYNKLAADLPAINIANDLKGTDADTAADGTMYILANGSNGVGFYKADGTIPAGKAYYKSSTGVKEAFFFGGDDATGINEELIMKNEESSIYNLAGQRIQKMQKGINIINGKKVLF